MPCELYAYAPLAIGLQLRTHDAPTHRYPQARRLRCVASHKDYCEHYRTYFNTVFQAHVEAPRTEVVQYGVDFERLSRSIHTPDEDRERFIEAGLAPPF
jgi:hypothetical protein